VYSLLKLDTLKEPNIFLELAAKQSLMKSLNMLLCPMYLRKKHLNLVTLVFAIYNISSPQHDK